MSLHPRRRMFDAAASPAPQAQTAPRAAAAPVVKIEHANGQVVVGQDETIHVLNPILQTPTIQFELRANVNDLTSDEMSADGRTIYTHISSPDNVGAALSGQYAHLATIHGGPTLKGHILTEAAVVSHSNSNSYGLCMTPMRKVVDEKNGAVSYMPFCENNLIDSHGQKSTYQMEPNSSNNLNYPGFKIFSSEVEGAPLEEHLFNYDSKDVERQCVAMADASVAPEEITLNHISRYIPAKHMLATYALHAWEKSFPGIERPAVIDGRIKIPEVYFAALNNMLSTMKDGMSKRTIDLANVAIAWTRRDGKSFKNSKDALLPVNASTSIQFKYYDRADFGHHANESAPAHAFSELKKPMHMMLRDAMIKLHESTKAQHAKYINDIGALKQGMQK